MRFPFEVVSSIDFFAQYYDRCAAKSLTADISFRMLQWHADGSSAIATGPFEICDEHVPVSELQMHMDDQVLNKQVVRATRSVRPKPLTVGTALDAIADITEVVQEEDALTVDALLQEGCGDGVRAFLCVSEL